MRSQERSRGGRRRKDTPETRARILAEIRRGVGKCRAAILAGVSVDSLARWESEDAGFAEAVKGAELASVAALERVVNSAARRGSWQAALRLLAVRAPAEYRPQHRQIEASVQVTMASLIAELDRRRPEATATAPEKAPTTEAESAKPATIRVEFTLTDVESQRTDRNPGDAGGFQTQPGKEEEEP